jgi:HEAT repeat protein
VHTDAPVHTQDDEPQGPTKEQLTSAITALKTGLAEETAAARIAALGAAAEVVHPDVDKAIAGALTDTAPEVRDYTLDLLGKIDEPSALATLHAYAKKHRRTLPDEIDLYTLVLKSAARHGDPSTIELLTDKFFDVEHHVLIRTRIFCLANIRDKRAVEALFDVMTKANPRRVTPHDAEFQLAFNVLLGIDFGKNRDRWLSWWNDNRKSFELAKVLPKLPQDSMLTWQQFWGLERTYERNEKRGDRGK